MLFDGNLLFERHISNIGYTHLKKNIKIKLQHVILLSNAEMLIHAFMTSRLDYCNALTGSVCLVNILQLVQIAAARVLTRTRRYNH